MAKEEVPCTTANVPKIDGAYLQMWDLRNPLFPNLLGQVVLPSVIEAIDFNGTWAYVANHTGGLQIVDVESVATEPVAYSTIFQKGTT